MAILPVMDRSDTKSTAARQRLSHALSQVGEGSRAALSEVYDATSAKLFGICLRILHDRSEAEDALQDIYLNVWRKAGKYDPDRASPITWLAALARNRAIDRLRSSGGRTSASIDEAAAVADPTPDAAAAIEATQERQRLARCVEELEENKGAAIRTAFFEGATYADLAERAGVPLGTMKSWVRRGLLQLKECLQR